MNCQIKKQQIHIEALESSPLFYLSAGSKELFHSNFLYWLALCHWDIFIIFMRKFAGLNRNQRFWWENDFHFDNKKIKVMREHKNFDLSIYIHIRNNKWVPVLVLENKVKSLPYAAQLEEYTQKANKDWCQTDHTFYKTQYSSTQNKITFILLSLTDASSLRQDADLKNWSFKTYDDLIGLLKREIQNKTMDNYHLQLCEDYCSFISALSNLTKTWNIDPRDKFLARLCPKTLQRHTRQTTEQYSETQILEELRLNDVWQKVSFDKLRSLLASKLKSSQINISDKPFKKNKTTAVSPGFYLSTGYTRDIGLIELRYVIEDNSQDKEPLSVMIQIQNGQYRYAITANPIANIKNKVTTPNWNLLKDKAQTFSSWMEKAPVSNHDKWCHFGDTFIYQYRSIKNEETIENIMNCVVKDAQIILETFKK